MKRRGRRVWNTIKKTCMVHDNVPTVSALFPIFRNKYILSIPFSHWRQCSRGCRWSVPISITQIKPLPAPVVHTEERPKMAVHETCAEPL